MKRIWIIAGIAALVALVGVAAIGAVALAQDEDGGPFDFAQRFREAIAQALGVSVEQYDSAVEKAKTQVVDEALSEGWLTQDQADALRERMAQEPGFGMHGMGRGFMDRGFMGPKMGFMGPGGDSPWSIAAEKLGMTEAELRTELQAGRTIADLAKAKGIDTQQIVDAYVVQLEQNLKQAVADGKITQKQADWMLTQAKEQATGMLDNVWQDRGFGGMGHGGMGRGGDALLTIAAQQLGMTEAELRTELQAGKTIADLAKEKGVDTAKIVDAYVAQMKETLAQAVTDGRITQEQADAELAHAQEQATDMLDNTWLGHGPGMFPGGGRPGRMWEVPGQSDA